MSKTIILSSGGTGGHVFPALSLAHALNARGYQVVIITDHRGESFQKATGISKVIALPIWQSRGRFGHIVLAFGLILSFLLALGYMVRLRPAAVVGFGGYPSIPAVLAGKVMGVPTALHEMNAILGRANRFLARFVKRIAIPFEKVKYTEPYQSKLLQTGNPVRKFILSVREASYQAPRPSEPFRLFIVGGSQGARVFSIVIPDALCGLPQDMRNRLVVHQQCRKELLEATKRAYKQSGINIDIRPFFKDVDQQLREASLVIGRAGASTVAELTVVGRPAILVPYPFALDNHQQANAMSLSEGGAAWVILERDFSAPKLREVVLKAMEKGTTLKSMAKKMHDLGQPDATENLAQMVETLLI
jgi:UDP-N-acetylglucosamine--N-acetylmuramyl-(pentapeptide) pyrophosphoryl-undecaprenol N-acetylglucosamine transferase